MTNKKLVTGKIRKSIVAAMATITFLTAMVGTPVNAFAATPDVDQAIMDEIENMDFDMEEVDGAMPEWAKESTSALIKTGVGAIPVIGNFAEALDPMLKELFGLGASDDTGESLQEIKDMIANLDLMIRDGAREQMASLYSTDKLNKFNYDITAVRNMTMNYLDQIAGYMENPNLSEVEKAILIGSILDKNTSSTTDYLSVVDTITSYVKGDAVNNYPESICAASYYVNCADSVLGGEAALKNSAYINNVVTILEQAYKLEAMVFDSKIVLAKNWTGKDENGNPYMSDEEKTAIEKNYSTTTYKNLIAECKIEARVNDWKRDSGIVDKNGQYTGVKRKYQLILDTENPNSTVSQYNKMVEDNWCSFIRSAEFPGLKANVVMVPIKIAVGKDYNNEGIGIQNYKNYQYSTYKDMVNNVRDRVNANVQNSGLTVAEMQRMLSHIMEEPVYAYKQNESDITDLFRLNNFGFEMVNACSYDKEGILKRRFPDGVPFYLNTSDLIVAMFFSNPVFVTGASTYNDHSIGYAGYGARDTNQLTINYVDVNGKAGSFNPVDVTDYPSSTTGCRFDDRSDNTYHRFVWFEQADVPATLDCLDTTSYDTEIAEIDAEIADGLRINEVDCGIEDTGDVNEDTVVITAVDGELTGENEGDAWTVEADGTLILNDGYKFCFEGTVEDRNIINYGEIVDGEFKNVNLTLTDNGIVTKGIFTDSEITYEDASVIGEEVELNNTNLVDLKAANNPEETDTDITEIADQN